MALRLLADEELLLAELPLPVLLPDDKGQASVRATLTLTPPAGRLTRKLSLALVSARPDGSCRLHEQWRFARPRGFIQPCLEGAVHLQPAWPLPTLRIDMIVNPRPADNISGTLALEIWSLDRPYQGGDFRGEPLGSLRLGSLAGQRRWNGLSQSWELPVLQRGQRPGGHLTLMLREWTSAGYVTRDWRRLEWPRHPARETVSLNRSSTAALRALPGLSDKLARTIVASRPFASIGELQRVRHMNHRIFDRLRDLVTL